MALFGILSMLSAVALLTTIVYRLYLSPLARANVPGPRLAAVTGLYEMYYDLWLGGRFPWKLMSLHQQYGPIVRTTPDQVHIHDSSFVPAYFSSSLLAHGSKYAPHASQMGVPDAIISTTSADTHRLRRAALAPFLSPSALAVALSHIESHRQSGKPLELRLLFWYLSTDIITALAFPSGIGLLDSPTLDPGYHEFATGGQRLFQWFKYFPILIKLLKSIPPRWMVYLAPGTAKPIAWEMRNQAVIAEIISEHERNPAADGPTAFHLLLRNPTLPASEKAPERLQQEVGSLVGAGGETISNTLYLLSNPGSLARLQADLNAAMPDAGELAPLATLQTIPYLAAVVNEGLRFANGVSSRFIRVAERSTVQYGEWNLPPGTAVGMSTMLVHGDPKVFLDPEAWRPERWLRSGKTDKDLEEGEVAASLVPATHLVAFGKGSRTCLGIHLAHAELYMILGILLRRFTLELFETGLKDVKIEQDALLPKPAKTSKGVRVIVK
ncbi:hypothetical protein MMC17_000379 [Xylographa soralifera]|nr:hypothetical protein [Xylographa soralifera]